MYSIYNCFSFGQININKTKPFATQKDQPLHVVGVKFWIGIDSIGLTPISNIHALHVFFSVPVPTNLINKYQHVPTCTNMYQHVVFY